MTTRSSNTKKPAEQVVKDIRRATRRHFSAEDKIRIVLDGLRGEDSIAELCRKEGIAQSLYYTWSKEFMEAGKRRLVLAPGQIWNANRHQLANALDLPWIEAIDMGSVPDRPVLLQEALQQASWQADLVVTTGGVSVGDEDHMPAVLRAAGGEIHVAKVAMKPGKPLIVGQVGPALYFGLPGSPVAAFISWHVIGTHIAQALAGIAEAGPHHIPVRADFERFRQPGRCEYLPVQLGGHDGHGTRSAKIVTTQVSHRVALLAQADGLLIIPAESELIKRGDILEFLPFSDG